MRPVAVTAIVLALAAPHGAFAQQPAPAPAAPAAPASPGSAASARDPPIRTIAITAMTKKLRT